LNGETADRRRVGDVLIGVTTVFWGASYFLNDVVLAELRPFTLTAVRFILSFALTFIVLFPKMRRPSRATLKYSALLAGLLVFIYVAASYGLMNTSVSNAGFLGGLAVIITPTISIVLLKKKPERRLMICAAICVVGIALLTLSDELTINPGDVLCLSVSFGNSVHLLLTERAVRDREVNALQVGVCQQGFLGAFAFIIAVLLERPERGLIDLPSSANVWIALILLTVFCSAAAFVFQSVAQQWTSAVRAGVIFAMEPVVAGACAHIFANERLLPRNYLGGALMVASLLFSEIDFGKIRR
jgi:drug/metabolite transporter (DMT)-like permease